MVEGETFRSLIRRVRAGDQHAATLLVQEFEPEIRRVVRLRLTDPRQRRLIDSSDICQSVLANFFVRAAAGQFDIDSPEQLLKLLGTMAKNRLINHINKNRAQRRDSRRELNDPEQLAAAVALELTPSRVAVGAELMARVRAAMNEEELRVFDLRGENRSWNEIAELVGGTPESVRKRYERTMDRIGEMLRLDESSLR
jgi:RNA polymerase sigma-70 factor (ECF subfamily)